jgi:anti-sigma regulatory factor (Ser/Thr protein kinase)
MHATTTLPAHAGTPRVARRWAVEVCEAAGLADGADRVAVVVSELVTNAVVHGRSEVTLQLSASPVADTDLRSLRIEVADADSRLPRWDCLDADALGGRGLHLVAALSDGYGYDVTDLGKTVWAQLELVAAADRTVDLTDAHVTPPPPRAPVALT